MSSDTVRFFTGILYFFSESNFHPFIYWSSSDTLLSPDGILGPALSYAVCTYETRYWAQPFSNVIQTYGINWPPQYYRHNNFHIFFLIIVELGFYFSRSGSPLTSYHHLSVITFHFGNYEKFCGPRVIDISIDIFELLHSFASFYIKINMRFPNQQGKK